ncbi:hypothetical protein D9M73_270390 [compost metagenome]
MFAEDDRKRRFDFFEGAAVPFIALGSTLDVVPVLAGDHNQLSTAVEPLRQRGTGQQDQPDADRAKTVHGASGVMGKFMTVFNDASRV